MHKKRQVQMSSDFESQALWYSSGYLLRLFEQQEARDFVLRTRTQGYLMGKGVGKMKETVVVWAEMGEFGRRNR